jgi:hypothetical protein
MGKYLLDVYSILHFTVGILWCYMGFDIISLLLIHTIFEIIENSKIGMYIINTYLKIWPGGKPSADTLINSISDISISLIGWILADKYFRRNNTALYSSILIVSYFWIFPHIILRHKKI